MVQRSPTETIFNIIRISSPWFYREQTPTAEVEDISIPDHSLKEKLGIFEEQHRTVLGHAKMVIMVRG